jgi:hypothetical protein
METKSTMQRLNKIILALAFAVACAGAADGRNTSETPRAEGVLKQARAALGGESKLRGVQGLTMRGKFRRVVQEREVSGEREADFLLPDKYMRTEELTLVGMTTSVTNTLAISGGEFWSSGGGRAGGVIMMRSDGKEPSAEDKARAAQAQARRMRAEMARYVLALLLTPTPDFPLTFAYAGEATADDGAAEVIDASGPDGFSARLFIDKQTHLPLMLTYRAPKPRVFTMTAQQGHGKSKEELTKEAQDRLKSQAEQKPEEVEMQVRFEDYRESGGLLLPHRITSGSEGETSEEWEIKSYALNPDFKADKFQKK